VTHPFLLLLSLLRLWVEYRAKDLHWVGFADLVGIGAQESLEIVRTHKTSSSSTNPQK
jgi:hypothetical protein